MWKAFIECCCVSGEQSSTSLRGAKQTKQNGTIKRRSPAAASSSSRSPPSESRTKIKREEVNADKSVLVSSDESESVSSGEIGTNAVASSSNVETTPLLCKRKNYLFYQNKLASKPDPGGLIDEIHAEWFGQYRLLESHHGYIQVRQRK